MRWLTEVECAKRPQKFSIRLAGVTEESGLDRRGDRYAHVGNWSHYSDYTVVYAVLLGAPTRIPIPSSW